MKLITNIQQHVERLLTSPAQELGSWAKFVRFQLQLWRLCARRLREHNVAAMSAALSFRMIFAMVPAIVLAVLVLQSIGALEDSKQNLRDFLDRSGFAQIALVQPGEAEAGPTTSGEPKVVNLAKEIEIIVERVESKLTFQRIGPVGAVLLIWTALSLLTTIEHSLNRIFGASRPRPLARRLLLYWSVLTLGPLVSMAASLQGRKIAQAFEDAPGASWILAAAGWAGPVIVGILVLAAIYKLLPNTNVRYSAAVGGAVVSLPIWLAAKWGFAIYVTKVVGAGNLYGALGLLPLFLIWVNLSWLIFLFGAELAHTAANLSSMQVAQQAQDIVLGPPDLLSAAIAVFQPYLAGRGPVQFRELTEKLRLPESSVRWLLERLASANIVCPVEADPEGSYVPTRPAESILVLEVLGLASRDRASTETRGYDSEIAQAVAQSMARTRSALEDFTLAEAVGSDDRSTLRESGEVNAPRADDPVPESSPLKN